MSSALSPSPTKPVTRKYTEHVGVKLNEKGNWLPFGGATIIARPSDVDGSLGKLNRVQEQLAANYPEYFRRTPLGSEHMTICEGTDPLKTWRKFATIQEASRWIFDRIKEKKLKFPATLALEVCDVVCDGTDYRILLQGIGTKHLYEKAHEACVDALGMSNADLPAFMLHMTLGYGIKVPSNDALEKIDETARELLGISFRFQAPEVAEFEDMSAFKPVYELETYGADILAPLS